MRVDQQKALRQCAAANAVGLAYKPASMYVTANQHNYEAGFCEPGLMGGFFITVEGRRMEAKINMPKQPRVNGRFAA